MSHLMKCVREGYDDEIVHELARAADSARELREKSWNDVVNETGQDHRSRKVAWDWYVDAHNMYQYHVDRLNKRKKKIFDKANKIDVKQFKKNLQKLGEVWNR